MIPIKRVVIEGPDCSGKTSLVEALKKSTRYSYNIQDRSNLSMYVYSLLNGRDDTRQYKRDFEEEIADQNNVIVLVLPKWAEVKKRYTKRGDDQQTLNSLEKLHAIFSSIASQYIARRNFIIVENGEEDADYIKESLKILSSQTIASFKLANCVSRTSGSESAKVKFVFRSDEIKYHSHDLKKSFKDEHEGMYYYKISSDLQDVIKYEQMGWNDDSRIQPRNSRRFIYTDKSCISLIHIIVEDNVLTAKCVCRSTNATKNDTDIEFLCRLACDVTNKFGEISTVIVEVEMNQLHKNPALY